MRSTIRTNRMLLVAVPGRRRGVAGPVTGTMTTTTKKLLNLRRPTATAFRQLNYSRTTTTTTALAGGTFAYTLQQQTSARPHRPQASAACLSTATNLARGSSIATDPISLSSSSSEAVAALTDTPSTTTTIPPRPSYRSLRTLFVASAIPMVGFGFMDNLVMIQAGQYIDSTLGVQLGLATMTAAAAGQVISDVSGVIFGGTLERLLSRLSLIKSPDLTIAQRELPICRNVSMAGAVIGVISGCTLGATTLFFLDLEARERIQNGIQLREIVTDMISDPNQEAGFACETCTVYVAGVDGNKYSLETPSPSWTTSEEDLAPTWRTSLESLNEAKSEVVQRVAQTHLVERSPDGRILYTPVIKDDHELVAVVEFRQKLPPPPPPPPTVEDDDNGTPQPPPSAIPVFTDDDVKTAKVMMRHLAIFIDRLD